jgi:hypothetical protein
MNDLYHDDEERVDRPDEEMQTNFESHEDLHSDVEHAQEMHTDIEHSAGMLPDESHTSEMSTQEARREREMTMREQPTRSDYGSGEEFAWLKDDECDELQSRWDAIQIEFVDDPRASVERADALVADTFERIQQEFSNRRKSLNEQWGARQDISTEDLRITLQHYRAFINRLLAL